MASCKALIKDQIVVCLVKKIAAPLSYCMPTQLISTSLAIVPKLCRIITTAVMGLLIKIQSIIFGHKLLRMAKVPC